MELKLIFNSLFKVSRMINPKCLLSLLSLVLFLNSFKEHVTMGVLKIKDMQNNK